MKKKALFFLLVLVVAGSFCFAEGLELGLTMLVMPRDSEILLGGGANIATSAYFTKNLGIGMFANVTYTFTNGVQLLNTDTLIGPVYKIIDKGNFSLPVSAGIYGIYTLAVVPGATAEGFNIGAGANITATMNFNQRISFYARVQGSYGFLGGGKLFIAPSIGIIL